MAPFDRQESDEWYFDRRLTSTKQTLLYQAQFSSLFSNNDTWGAYQYTEHNAHTMLRQREQNTDNDIEHTKTHTDVRSK